MGVRAERGGSAVGVAVPSEFPNHAVLFRDRADREGALRHAGQRGRVAVEAAVEKDALPYEAEIRSVEGRG